MLRGWATRVNRLPDLQVRHFAAPGVQLPQDELLPLPGCPHGNLPYLHISDSSLTVHTLTNTARSPACGLCTRNEMSLQEMLTFNPTWRQIQTANKSVHIHCYLQLSHRPNCNTSFYNNCWLLTLVITFPRAKVAPSWSSVTAYRQC